MFHIGAWVAWLAAAAVPAFTISNPLYLALVLGAAWLVYAALGRNSVVGTSWGAFVKLGLLLLALTIPFNALSVHLGQIVLFELPAGWPIVGGPITLEAVIAGAVSGLVLFTILVVFAAFNAVVDHYELLRATPAFLYHAGVIVSIAVTFVPQMVLSAREIRQAQRIRGHRFRGIRDLLPLILPLLANSLERAIQLAETMESRGFASVVSRSAGRRAIYVQAATLATLLALLAGLVVVAYLPGPRVWGWVLTAAGLAGLLATMILEGKQVHRTRYRRTRWHGRDTAVVVASALVLATVMAARRLAPGALLYVPYPPNSLLPPFDPVIGAALLLLVTPALLAPRAAEHAAPTGGAQPPASSDAVEPGPATPDAARVVTRSSLRGSAVTGAIPHSGEGNCFACLLAVGTSRRPWGLAVTMSGGQAQQAAPRHAPRATFVRMADDSH